MAPPATPIVEAAGSVSYRSVSNANASLDEEIGSGGGGGNSIAGGDSIVGGDSIAGSVHGSPASGTKRRSSLRPRLILGRAWG